MCFSFRGASPPDPLTRGSAPGLRWGSAFRPPIIGASHLHLGRLQLFNAGTVHGVVYLNFFFFVFHHCCWTLNKSFLHDRRSSVRHSNCLSVQFVASSISLI